MPLASRTGGVGALRVLAGKPTAVLAAHPVLRHALRMLQRQRIGLQGDGRARPRWHPIAVAVGNPLDPVPRGRLQPQAPALALTARPSCHHARIGGRHRWTVCAQA